MKTLSPDTIEQNRYVRDKNRVLAALSKHLDDLDSAFEALGQQTPEGSLGYAEQVFETYATRLLQGIAQERDQMAGLHWETTAGSALNETIAEFCRAAESHVGVLRFHVKEYKASFAQ